MPVDWRRREADLGRYCASMPPSDPARRSALYELLARRLRDPRYYRHGAAKVCRRPQLVTALPLADSHDPANPVEAHEPRRDGRFRRGGRQARTDTACFYVDGRYHGRNPADTDSDF